MFDITQCFPKQEKKIKICSVNLCVSRRCLNFDPYHTTLCRIRHGDNLLSIHPSHNQDPKLFQNKQSRLLTEYDEVKVLGSRAFDVVVSYKSKIDETTYAVNKIAIGDEQKFKFAGQKGGVDHVVAAASTYHTVPYGMA